MEGTLAAGACVRVCGARLSDRHTMCVGAPSSGRTAPGGCRGNLKSIIFRVNTQHLVSLHRATASGYVYMGATQSDTS